MQNLPEQPIDPPEAEYQHPEQESTDAERAENIRKRTTIEQINDELREITNCVDRLFRLAREQAE